MLYTPLTKEALKIAFMAHKDQKDKGGLPYIYHPYHLAELMDTEDEVVVALLHDVLEDQGDRFSLDTIAEKGFSHESLEALRLITHDKKEPYVSYVYKLCSNLLAHKVKESDLHHNLDETRLPASHPQNKKRSLYVFCLSLLEKYGHYGDKYPYYVVIEKESPLFYRIKGEEQVDVLLYGNWVSDPSIRESDIIKENPRDLTFKEGDEGLSNEAILSR